MLKCFQSRYSQLGCLLVLTNLGCTSGELQAGDLKLERVSHRPLNLRPADLGGVVTYGADAATYFLRQGQGIVQRLGDGESSLTKFVLERPPEAAGADLYFADIAVNSQIEMFLAGTWTSKPKGGGSAVFVYSASGRYLRTVNLAPSVNVRHLALDAAGNIFILAIDPGYFKGVANLCLLVHKYTPEGKRLTAFSNCPIPTGERSISAVWEPLSFEVDRGSIWLQDGKLYHVLPSAHVIRVFDAVTGVGSGEIALQPPSFEDARVTVTGPSAAWRVLPSARDEYVVVWSVTTASGRTSLVTVHDSHGSPATRLLHPMDFGMPVAAASRGHVLMLTPPQRDGTVGLWRGKAQIE